MGAAIELRKVEKRYGQRHALQPISLSFESGKTVALIGPSGCGKSTLLRLLVGLIEPDSGVVLIEGRELNRASALDMRHKIGYVIQEGGLFPHLTAKGNVLLMRRHLKLSEQENEARLAELAALVHLPAELLERYPAQLSGGQRQRVGLMRALALDPDILLLDEPLGALDPMVRSQLQQDLKELFAKLGKTVVFVTHDLAEAAYMADSIVLLREGQLVQRGTLDDFRAKPAEPFVTEFVNAQRSLVSL